jgi:hypothetical protein
MDNRKLYFGIYSDETLTEVLKKRYKKNNPPMNDECVNQMNEYVADKLANGVEGGTTTFFAKDLQEAKTTAKQMGLKSFQPISATIYEKGKDF